MVWLQLALILLVLFLLVYFAIMLGGIIIGFLINTIIVFLIAYRSYYEIKAGRNYNHLIGALAAVILLAVFGNFLSPLWLLTTFLIIAFTSAQIVQFVRKKSSASGKKHA